MPDTELDKLKDRSVKVLYLINPTNPGSIALSDEAIDNLVKIVTKDNPNLIIVVDAVYATFAQHHTSIIQKMPWNCITVYSFSKYFGVTGWRLGVIMLNTKNVIDDKLLKEQPAQWKQELSRRYGIDALDVDSTSFIQRMVFDSRDVALAHTGGISGPQQVAMALFSLYDIMDTEKGYREHLWDILDQRVSALYDGLDISRPKWKNPEQHTNYYCLIDILDLAETLHPSKGNLRRIC